MAKKRFTDGLDSLFGASGIEKDFEDRSPLLVEDKKQAKPKKEFKKSKKTKRKAGKSFTSDLDSLFSSSIYEKKEKKSKGGPKISRPAAEPQSKNIFGLDALIRKTIDLPPEEVYIASAKKRVTFVYDRKKLELLKKIARKNNAYMKDIIGNAVSQWINEYEEKNGKISEN